MVKFDEEDIGAIECVMDKYRGVDIILERIRKDADELGKRLIDTENEKKRITAEEADPLMERLHKKYGDFSLNDVLENLKR